jgi:hypothetical protein
MVLLACFDTLGIRVRVWDETAQFMSVNVINIYTPLGSVI